MTQIKSENAKRILQAYYVDGDNNRHLFFLKGLEALEIAEKEAEERHAKELQELKNKAIEAHRQACRHIHNWYCSDLNNRVDNGECNSKCSYIQDFTQKLNEK